MNKNRVFPTIVFSLALAVLPLLVGCQIAGPQNVALAAPEENQVDYQAIENAMNERWQAMARFYEQQSLATFDLTKLSAEEVVAYRWEALAHFYNEHPFAGVALTELSADNVSEYRWLAIAQYYEKYPYAGVDLTTLDPGEVSAFRWLATARACERLGLIQTK
jgi:hypothetical protein